MFKHLLIFTAFVTLSLSSLAQEVFNKSSFQQLNAEGVMIQYLVISNTEVAVDRKPYGYRETVINIPESVKNRDKTYVVTKINEMAFSESTLLKEVNMSHRITEIGNCAFYNCYALSTIQYSASLKKIGMFCFGNCRLLEKSIFPNSLEYIDESAFSNCKSLKSVSLPASTKLSPNWNKGCDAKIEFR
ncbi:leucine-rich repeat domain-containing protein [Bacteroides sp. 519]|uniref:leucine-rich repeat domain-containing protein n=1 Tax=Bacteroides sp. 519 TaxID=2302937 RepID=UPI0013CF42AB|nr:leucine-rich repeat domain-containing protein [Bacteroides sp. 519]NDV57646.1 leucine-rich repeat domain-containing protein [Bacteroides sp. 519]